LILAFFRKTGGGRGRHRTTLKQASFSDKKRLCRASRGVGRNYADKFQIFPAEVDECHGDSIIGQPRCSTLMEYIPL
jgi:hypothetical protein